MPRYHLALGVAALFVVCTTARAELGEGSSGPEVRAVQRALNLYGSRLDVEGVFKEDTVRAVRRFQRLHDLQVTGVVNDATLERLMQPFKMGDKGSPVRRLQRLIDTSVTGTYRVTTEDAVKRLQRENDLEATGEFSPRLLGLLDGDPESAVAPEPDPAQDDDGTRTDDPTGAGATDSSGSGLDGLGADANASDSASSNGDSGSSGSGKKVGDALKDLFTGLAKSGQGGGGQFANGQGPNSGSGSAGSGSSGRALGGGVSQKEDPLAHLNQSGSTQTGQGSQSSQQGSQGGQQGGQQGSQGGEQGGQQGSQGGQQGGQQGSQGGEQGGQQGSQSGQEQSQQQGKEDDAFTSKELPFKSFKSLTELAEGLETLKVIEQIQEALGKGTIEEPLVKAMRTMQGKLKSAGAKSLIDLAIKVYEIPSPDGKKKYVQPALVAVLKAKAVEIGAVPQGPGSSAPATAQAAYGKQVAARFPGLK